LKITEGAHIFGYFFPRIRLSINFDKNGLGYTLGHFFENASGHPVCQGSKTSRATLQSEGKLEADVF
jgi:hypothetical protein